MTEHDLIELELKLFNMTPGEWKREGSHICGPDPARQLICQIQDTPAVENLEGIIALKNQTQDLISYTHELRAMLNTMMNSDPRFTFAVGGNPTAIKHLFLKMQQLTE